MEHPWRREGGRGSRTTGKNWARGYKTYRHGQVVGFVAPLERLAVRSISVRFLSQDERIEIADLRHTGFSIRDSRSPWQRGSNENTNGLLRDYFPKGTDLGAHSPERLLAVEIELNNRPRIVLDDRSPAELFTALLASDNPPVLRR